MLPTLVIGLREGLEAALIVGIIAAFLRKQGRRDLLRQVWIGVSVAIALCLAVGLALQAVSANLPQRQQEGLETVIGALAVGMVTYMVVWMRRNARGLKAQLEGLAADALDPRHRRAGLAMVAMAFLAVMREGLETVVFLLAAFNETANGALALTGAVLGIAIALVLGYGIYRGGVRINLSKFFRATGLVLVLVAAGLVVSALHTAHEAGWLQVGQTRVLDLSALVRPGSIQSSLLTGMLGVQPYPVLIEVLGWLLYLVPVALFVAWPPARPVPMRLLSRSLAVLAVLGLVVAGVAAVLTPGRPSSHPITTASSPAGFTAQVSSLSGSRLALLTQPRWPVSHRTGPTTRIDLRQTDTSSVQGMSLRRYSATLPSPGAGSSSGSTLSASRVAGLNQGRLPLGVVPRDGQIRVRYDGQRTVTALVEPRTGRVIDVRWTETTKVLARGASGLVSLSKPLASASTGLSSQDSSRAARQARADLTATTHRSTYHTLTATALVLGLLSGLLAGLAGLALRRRPKGPESVPAHGDPVTVGPDPTRTLARR